jgi:CheY-like chemotaxis protein
VPSQPDLEVVGQAGDGREATWLARELRPGVVLMDIRMPVLDRLAATRQIVAPGNGEPGGTIVRVIVSPPMTSTSTCTRRCAPGRAASCAVVYGYAHGLIEPGQAG